MVIVVVVLEVVVGIVEGDIVEVHLSYLISMVPFSVHIRYTHSLVLLTVSFTSYSLPL